MFEGLGLFLELPVAPVAPVTTSCGCTSSFLIQIPDGSLSRALRCTGPGGTARRSG